MVERPNDDADDGDEPTIDNHELADPLFFRVFQSQDQPKVEEEVEGEVLADEILVFDQLNMKGTVGDAIVTTNVRVQNDFMIRCFRNDIAEQQIGETICLHTAFIEEHGHLRVSLTPRIFIDLFFSEEASTSAM